MSRKAMLSLWGLYTYNPDLFTGLTVPTDDNSEPYIDKQDLVDNLLLEAAELEVLYTDPVFMQQAIAAWSRKNLRVWTDLAETLAYDYDPIENYYRRESWDDDLTHGHKVVTNDDLTHGHTVTIADDATTTNSVTGYNGTGFADHDKTVLDDDARQAHTGTDQRDMDETHSGTDKNHREGYARGNIGVMSTQQMIEMQREVVKFNLMDYIIDDFKQRFCLLVY